MNRDVILGLMLPFAGTAAGSGCVFFMKRSLGRQLQRSLTGFAAGVMTAASIWSLLIPAMEQAGDMGKLAFVPAVAGFWCGVLFLLLLDSLIPHLHMNAEKGRAFPSCTDHYDGAGCNAAQHPRGNGCGHRICRVRFGVC